MAINSQNNAIKIKIVAFGIIREGVRILKIGVPVPVVNKVFFWNFVGLIYGVNSELFRVPGHPGQGALGPNAPCIWR